MMQQKEFLKNINDNRGIIYKIINLYIILTLMLVGIPLMYLAERANKFAFGKYIDKLTAHLKDMEASV
ncbi:hypothetical protein [Pedobacter steynii]|uniref:Uncharacterized protein n=1 Tax=Pedobacter steynii TaxID=430522 RepID=A0A1D7QKQ0_9SPHI|nr:hypothetical protein [Pedobacter steynii]AOM79255.1 hypothetical protein BFS30_20040 [Pedobacter steynii]